ncbi:MAG: pyroglutamyl-peptidase I [Promethearchaeota archaeon]
MNKIIVLTGFEPFGYFQVNPSWEAAKAFENRRIGSFNIKSFKIPLIYKEIKHAITKIIDAENPAIIISLGQSYRPVISLEKVALNYADLTDATVPYNCGTRPNDEILELNAPKAYFTKLPIRKILNKLQEQGIPAEISYTAGTFGCNQLFYTMMHKIQSEGPSTYAGFIHVPSLPSQAAKLQREKNLKIPSMNSETVIKAIEIAINVSIEGLG